MTEDRFVELLAEQVRSGRITEDDLLPAIREFRAQQTPMPTATMPQTFESVTAVPEPQAEVGYEGGRMLGIEPQQEEWPEMVGDTPTLRRDVFMDYQTRNMNADTRQRVEAAITSGELTLPEGKTLSDPREEGIGEMFTGRARNLGKAGSLESYTFMPEMQGPQGTIASTAGVEERVQIAVANGAELRDYDFYGNPILYSPTADKEYAIHAGLGLDDVAGTAMMMAPLGRVAQAGAKVAPWLVNMFSKVPGATRVGGLMTKPATSVLGAAAQEGAREGVFQAAQAGVGGDVSLTEMGIGAGAGALGRGISNVLGAKELGDVPEMIRKAKNGDQEAIDQVEQLRGTNPDMVKSVAEGMGLDENLQYLPVDFEDIASEIAKGGVTPDRARRLGRSLGVDPVKVQAAYDQGVLDDVTVLDLMDPSQTRVRQMLETAGLGGEVDNTMRKLTSSVDELMKDVGAEKLGTLGNRLRKVLSDRNTKLKSQSDILYNEIRAEMPKDSDGVVDRTMKYLQDKIDEFDPSMRDIPEGYVPDPANGKPYDPLTPSEREVYRALKDDVYVADEVTSAGTIIGPKTSTTEAPVAGTGTMVGSKTATTETPVSARGTMIGGAPARTPDALTEGPTYSAIDKATEMRMRREEIASFKNEIARNPAKGREIQAEIAIKQKELDDLVELPEGSYKQGPQGVKRDPVTGEVLTETQQRQVSKGFRTEGGVRRDPTTGEVLTETTEQQLSKAYRTGEGVDRINPATGESLQPGKILRSPSYNKIDLIRRKIGKKQADVAKKVGEIGTEEAGAINKLYGLLSEDIDETLEGLKLKGDISEDLYWKARDAKGLVRFRKKLEQDLTDIAGKTFEEDYLTTARSGVKELKDDAVTRFERMLNAVPKGEKRNFVVSSLLRALPKKGRVTDFDAFALFKSALDESPNARKIIERELPEGTLKLFDDLGELALGVFETSQRAKGVDEAAFTELANSKVSALRGLVERFGIFGVATLGTQQLQKGFGGASGGLGMNLFFLGTLRDVISGSEANRVKLLKKVLSSNELKKLIASDLDNKAIEKFANSRKLQLLLKQAGAVQNVTEAEQVLRSLVRANLNREEE